MNSSNPTANTNPTAAKTNELEEATKLLRIGQDPNLFDQEAIREQFSELLQSSLPLENMQEGRIVNGKVTSVDDDFASVDVGLKSEGRIAIKEFRGGGHDEEISVGDTVEVFLERFENAMGEAILSRDRARREKVWQMLEDAHNENTQIEGVIIDKVKGGFTVDIDGTIAFLPGSQVDVRPMRDITPLMNMPQPFNILKMDRRRGNIVVSRRAVLETQRAGKMLELVEKISEGDVLEGVVKNITAYGAFVDLGGVDGLLHVTDMAWHRVADPSEVVAVGDTVTVKVTRLYRDTQRISLGMKQLKSDPWSDVASRYPVGSRVEAKVANVTDYGAFVELEPGIEGLVHISEMSWVKKNVTPSKIVASGDVVQVEVLDVNAERRRMSLGMKQCMASPWSQFAVDHPVNSEIEGPIRNVTEFGLFVAVHEDLDGMVHASDIDWDREGGKTLSDFNVGDNVKAVVMEIDIARERIGLSIKHLSEDPLKVSGLRQGATVTCEVKEVKESGLDVEIVGTEITSFIRRGDLSQDKTEQRPDRFAPGEKVDARVMKIALDDRKVTLSIRALEAEAEKEAVAKFGSTTSGASLRDILGEAMSRASEERNNEESAAAAAAAAEEKKPAKAKTSAKKTATKASADDAGADAASADAKGDESAEVAEVAGADADAKPAAKAKAKPKAKAADKAEEKAADEEADATAAKAKTTKKAAAKKSPAKAEDEADEAAKAEAKPKRAKKTDA